MPAAVSKARIPGTFVIEWNPYQSLVAVKLPIRSVFYKLQGHFDITNARDVFAQSLAFLIFSKRKVILCVLGDLCLPVIQYVYISKKN